MEMQNINKVYTYSDYLNFPENERWEIIDGVAFRMEAPSWEHQFISSELVTLLNMQLRGTPCRAVAAAFDLRLPKKNEKDEDISTVVQPDILVICDRKGLKGSGYVGVPNFIIEILSPSTLRIDRTKKLDKYEKSGVKEYWIIDIEKKEVMVFILNNGIYSRPECYYENDKIKLKALENVEIDLDAVFSSIK
ncbi:MAG: Uma2 family endonuclease [Oscillospiraceae bacterium]|nr:Uma2 family endonuclease [Oscillospiraceae bacterium]